VSGYAMDTRDIPTRSALLGISTLPPGTMGIPTLPPAGRKKVAFQRVNHHQKLNFLCKRDKNIILLKVYVSTILAQASVIQLKLNWKVNRQL